MLPSHGLVHYIYIGGAVAPNIILQGAKFALRPSLAFSYTGSVTVRHSSNGWASAKLCGVVSSREGGHPVRYRAVELYSYYYYCYCYSTVASSDCVWNSLHTYSCQASCLPCDCLLLLPCCASCVFASGATYGIVMAALRSRCGHYSLFLPCGFFHLSSIFFIPRLISADANWMSTILLHMV